MNSRVDALDSLRDDTVVAWRRLKKSKVTSAAAVLSLALAIGSCTSAFRLIDALLLRPMPVAHPERLYSLSRPNFDSWEYGHFTQMRAAAENLATLIAVSFAEQVDVTFSSDTEFEKAHVQYVSGSMFGEFGLRAAAGRLLTQSDDIKPGGHPVAVLSHDYWSRRFGQDPNVIGHTFRLGDTLYEIIGVSSPGFTGTEPGTVIDIFMPAMMHWAMGHEWSVFRAFVALPPGVAVAEVRDRLGATLHSINEDKARLDPKRHTELLVQRLSMEPAAAGVSGLQKNYRLSLTALGALVALVLLIACANVANLMTAQAAARSREMALRVSIGAARWRLVQLVLVESAWIAILAAALGTALAWRGPPFIVSMISVGMITSANDSARLLLPMDWRVLGFGIALTLGVTFLFGLAPALRASAVNPVNALKGGDDPRSRRQWMRTLIGVQTAFCFLVLFVAGLFVVTFQKLSNRPTGISSERILTLYTVSRRDQPPALWNQVAEHLRNVNGVEKVALAEWPILDGWGYRTSGISVEGAPPNDVGGWFLYISPGMLDVMKIPIIDGRDFWENDSSVAIVNASFARQYFNSENPIGKWFVGRPVNGPPQRFRIIGLVRDARYRYLWQEFLPVAYLPFHRVDANGEKLGRDRGTFIVRTAGANLMALESLLRQEIPRARPEFRVSSIRSQKELIDSQTIRERLLAMLALFFAVVALLLASVGLYGVLNYCVQQRRREIGIRLAIGAPSGAIARLVTMDIALMVIAGAIVGLAIGMASARYMETLFYQVRPSDAGVLAVPALALFGATFLSSIPAVMRAVRIDPVETLRSE